MHPPMAINTNTGDEQAMYDPANKDKTAANTNADDKQMMRDTPANAGNDNPPMTVNTTASNG